MDTHKNSLYLREIDKNIGAIFNWCDLDLNQTRKQKSVIFTQNNSLKKRLSNENTTKMPNIKKVQRFSRRFSFWQRSKNTTKVWCVQNVSFTVVFEYKCVCEIVQFHEHFQK